MVVLAQLVEHRIVVPSVVGSSPTFHPKTAEIPFGIAAVFLCGCTGENPFYRGPHSRGKGAKKERPLGRPFPCGCLRSVLGVVRFSADFPQVLRQGLATTGGVTLREERSVVLVDLHEVFTTLPHCLGYRIEACADEQLLCRRIGRTVVLTYHVDARTIRVGGSRYAVGGEQDISVVAVRLTFLGTSTHKAGYIVNTLTPFNFSHSLVCFSWFILFFRTLSFYRGVLYLLAFLHALILFLAGSLLVYVPKLRFSSKYSERLRSSMCCEQHSKCHPRHFFTRKN